MSVYSIGVDLGGTNLRVAAVSEQGKLLEKLTTGTEVKQGPRCRHPRHDGRHSSRS